MSDSFFLRWLGPGSLNGIRLGLWLKLLSQNRWSVAPRYLGRAAVITLAATLNSIGGAVDQLRFGRAIERAAVHPPLFVLGVWRSGTTHLLNLMCQDARFGYPNAFQAMNPHIFLSTERWLAPFEQLFFPATRPFDAMRMGVCEPHEDEFAIAALSGLSSLCCWVFPKNHREYEKYVDLSAAPEPEVDRWTQALVHFVKKLSLKYDKPLVLKSPNHTARVRLLVELFPQAKFVYIHRHPHEVYASGLKMVRGAVPIVTVQHFDVEELSDRLIPLYRTLTERYLDERSLIPESHLVEIGFNKLEQSPIATLRYVYEQLKLPTFDVAEPAIREYVDSLRGYRKNVHPEVDADTKLLLAREWKRSFDEWGYSVD